MRNILESALRQADPDLAEPLHAATGVEALAALDHSEAEDRPLDLILCDVHMPKMNGLDFLLEKKRRNLAPEVPVVLVTADDRDPKLLQALSVGAQGFISKPFTQNQIETCVASLMLATSSPSAREGI
jgi:two-component system chemotaxis response regulator CheY